ncbi:MAG: tripartite ATP-independent transporter DctM subunit [Parasphingorhabdus sp.]|jgi:tripartite ATP-independent transporter DctM subunit
MEVVFLVILILLMVVSLSSGFPVAFALPGSAIGAVGLAALCGYLFAGDPSAYFAQDGPVQWLTAGVTNFRSLYWQVERDTLIAIPLFVFMGIMLQRSKIAEDLLVAMAQLFGPVPGGLGISVVFVGALLAATTGILGATVIAMGLISLPAMLKNNYSKPMATGVICASGTLGQIIPPSIVLIILADQLANAADQARTLRAAEYKAATGEFSMPAELDVTSASAGDMFMGALVPGLILVGLYMAYILFRAITKPGTAPPVPYDGDYDRTFFTKVGIALVPPLALIFAVLGSIISGIATVNQAGAIGAVGAIVMGGYRLVDDGKHRYTPLIIATISVAVILVLLQLFDLNVKSIKSQRDLFGIVLALIAVVCCLSAIVWSAWRTFKINNTLTDVMIDTAKTTSMVFIILIGAAMLTAAFRGFGGEHLVREFLTGLPGGFWSQFLVVMLVIFLLGFFLDFIEIAVVVVPIVAPILLADPAANVTAVWLGVMIGLNIQTSFLTPPFGFALFYLRGVAPPEVKTTHIYKGAVAFIGLQLVGLSIAGFFPGLVNYMPNRTHLTSDTAPPPVNPKLQACMEQRLFPIYLSERDRIIAAVDNFTKADLGILPAAYAALKESPAKVSATFALVENINQSTAALDEYIIDYRPIQSEVRQILNKTKGIDERLKLAENKIKRLKRKDNVEKQIVLLEGNVARLKSNKATLEAQIPDTWDESKKGYKALALTDKKNRSAYRRNVDEAYEPIVNLKTVLASTEDLANLVPDVEAVAGVFDQTDMEFAQASIKSLESKLSAVKGSSSIKSLLSKSRRKLKGNSPDVAAARDFHQQALDLVFAELAWRNKAREQVLPVVNEYDAAIKGTVGLRLQDRFSKEQAKDIAGCLSSHKDVSLSF